MNTPLRGRPTAEIRACLEQYASGYHNTHAAQVVAIANHSPQSPALRRLLAEAHMANHRYCMAALAELDLSAQVAIGDEVETRPRAANDLDPILSRLDGCDDGASVTAGRSGGRCWICESDASEKATHTCSAHMSTLPPPPDGVGS